MTSTCQALDSRTARPVCAGRLELGVGVHSSHAGAAGKALEASVQLRDRGGLTSVIYRSTHQFSLRSTAWTTPIAINAMVTTLRATAKTPAASKAP